MLQPQSPNSSLKYTKTISIWLATVFIINYFTINANAYKIADTTFATLLATEAAAEEETTVPTTSSEPSDPPTSSSTSKPNADDIIAIAVAEIEEFVHQENLTETEFGIIQSKNDTLIYVDIERRNTTDAKTFPNNKAQNDKIQSITSQMIEEDNQKIIEIEKRINTETEKDYEIISSSNLKPILNDDLIQVHRSEGAQTITDLVIDDDCGSEEEKSAEFKRIEESLKSSNYNQINQTQIDFKDFFQLVPVNDVRAVFQKYYNSDKDIRRAYLYLTSQEFTDIENRMVKWPEINVLIKYLKKYGLDVIQLYRTIVKIMGDPTEQDYYAFDKGFSSGTDMPNSDEMGEQENSTDDSISEKNGLHGLIDSILEILPQDQIISLFFEKLETDHDFSNLVNSIGSEEFSQILQRIENSPHTQAFIYTLHKNGIEIRKIIESLKAYFFLGF